MEKEEILLGLEMGKLEIEPVKLNRNIINENPFINPLKKRNSFKHNFLPKESKCSCLTQRKTKSSGIYKKKSDKVLKEPVLKILKSFGNTVLETCQNSQSSNNELKIDKCEPVSLCTLVQNCNQLKISSSTNVQTLPIVSENNYNRWWKNEITCTVEIKNNIPSTSELKDDVTCIQELKETKTQSSSSGSCSQQALNPPCDITIDELASYFETLVHIPKKMSSMAEMMYI